MPNFGGDSWFGQYPEALRCGIVIIGVEVSMVLGYSYKVIDFQNSVGT